MALIHITETACDEGDGLSHLRSGKAKAVPEQQRLLDLMRTAIHVYLTKTSERILASWMQSTWRDAHCFVFVALPWNFSCKIIGGNQYMKRKAEEDLQ
jgi:hypothetical protein